MKKILLLGGSFGQIPAVLEAKRRNLYTILCDYLPDNPGKDLADEYHPVSTIDIDKILQLAREKEIDCILAYASDPASLTAAYVSKSMGLFGNSPASVELLSCKNLFRKFQSEHGFNTPWFKIMSNLDDHSETPFIPFFPVIVKPVDSSDTKGVTRVERKPQLRKALVRAFKYSRCGKIIIEECIDSKVARLHGDGFVVNGKLEFCELGDQVSTSKTAPLKPTSTSFPSEIEKAQLQRVYDEAANIIHISGFKNGPINIEARINSKNRVYIMEIGARCGGHLTGQCIGQYCGFDMLKAHFDLLEGKNVIIKKTKAEPSLFYVLFSDYDGYFRDFHLHDDIMPYIAEYSIYKKAGDAVKSFNKPGSDLGTLVFNFKTPERIKTFKNNLHCKISDGLHIDEIPQKGHTLK